MSLGERIKYLRKKHLNMTQETFGKILGSNRDVIFNIEKDRLANPEQKDPMYRLICKEFNVNYEWLMTGAGEMLTQNEDNVFDRLVEELNLTDIPKLILAFYMSLDEPKRNAVDMVLMEFINTCKDEGVSQYSSLSPALSHVPTPESAPADANSAAPPAALVITEDMTEEEAIKKVSDHFTKQKKPPLSDDIGQDKAMAERLLELERRLERMEAEKALLANENEKEKT